MEASPEDVEAAAEGCGADGATAAEPDDAALLSERDGRAAEAPRQAEDRRGLLVSLATLACSIPALIGA